jgi:ABC-type dipeptide/oligopeptide/nickel transport system ATPase subunit
MADTLRASITGLKIVDQARRKKRWTKTTTLVWWETAMSSRATLKRFWEQKSVQKETFINLCKAVGISDWQDIVDWSIVGSDSDSEILTQDWGEAPGVLASYGRTEELAQLQSWVLQDNSRLISIIGSAGIGKTHLATVWADSVQERFDSIVWRSLRQAPSLNTFIAELPAFLFQRNTEEFLLDPMGQVVSAMYRSRCLLVLDQAEAILNEGTGQYQEGYADYGELLRQIGARRHSSCLMLITQEPFPNLISLEQQTRFVRSLRLSHLQKTAVWELLQTSGLSGETGWDALLELYGGNPQVLLLIAATIRDVFAGNVNHFLKECGTLVIPKPIETALNRQLHSLSGSEMQIIRALATVVDPLSFSQLQTRTTISKADLPQILARLKGRSLVETLIEESVDQYEVLFLVPLVLKKHILRTRLNQVLH